MDSYECVNREELLDVEIRGIEVKPGGKNPLSDMIFTEAMKKLAKVKWIKIPKELEDIMSSVTEKIENVDILI